MVFPFVRVGWVKQPAIQFRFVAQQQKPFRIGIQPADRINVFRKTKLFERAMI
jgi:hypothetical protein